MLLIEGQCLVLQQSGLAWRSKGETVNEAGSKAMVWQMPSSLFLGSAKNMILKKGEEIGST